MRCLVRTTYQQETPVGLKGSRIIGRDNDGGRSFYRQSRGDVDCDEGVSRGCFPSALSFCLEPV